jgi:DNA-binding Lrp family transcriptional regulator
MILDDTDRALINALQGGFPLCERPYEAAAADLGLAESELIVRLERLLADRVLTRFGPLFNADAMGGGFLLAAMKIPEAEFERVAERVNAHPEVAHNYAREHAFNMWFVLGAETPDRIERTIAAIEAETGYPVHRMPKLDEFFIEARFAA